MGCGGEEITMILNFYKTLHFLSYFVLFLHVFFVLERERHKSGTKLHI